MTLGILHPGKMGSSVGHAAGQKANVIWASEGRSDDTQARAASDSLTDVQTLDALVTQSDIIMSVCPPHAAANVAKGVANRGFKGIYVDANAVAPQTASEVAKIVRASGASFVDGGIIGPPARQEGITRLYLSGQHAQDVKKLFEGTLLDTFIIGEALEASALKMAYAAWTKGSSALLLSVAALAKELAVEDALRQEWTLSQPQLEDRLEQVASRTPPKAWRFKGEMLEIAKTYQAAGLPNGFHSAASSLYERLEDFKERDLFDVQDVINALLVENNT